MANGIIDNDRKRAVFLSVFGPMAYQLLSSLVAPAKVGEKSYDDLVKTISEHRDLPPSEIVQRFKFHTRTCDSRESIADYVAAFRALGQEFGFGDTLDDMQRDRLACGVNDDNLQRRLLGVTDRNLDVKKALKLAVSMEAAKKNARELQNCAEAGAGRSPP